MGESILIIGTGTFGTSTALALATRHPLAQIHLIDPFPLPSLNSAAFDLNKIIRTEYSTPFYTSLSLSALSEWRRPFWKDIFHETGWISTTSASDPKGAGLKELRTSYENLVREGQGEGVVFLEGREMVLEFVPQLALAGAEGLESWCGIWNPAAGWAHARNALVKVGEEAAKLGVKFTSGAGGTMTDFETEELEGRKGKKITGVRVAGGEVLRADRYILATGAASPALLPELSTELWSKCWTLAHIELTEAEATEFKNMPVVYSHELGFCFEPDTKNRWIKICNNFPGYEYRAGEFVDTEGRKSQYSVPRYAAQYPGDGIPLEAEQGIRKFVDTVLPRFSGRPLVGARICWCTDSPDSHYLIDYHPGYPGGELLLATGDSGHAFKMLPIIGEYIADAFEGEVKPEWRFGGRENTGNPTRAGDEVKDLRDVGIGAL